MSYKLGLQAFIGRFRKRFPEPTYQWKIKNNVDSVACVIFSGDVEVVRIYADTDFGIRLSVRSKYLNTSTTDEYQNLSMSYDIYRRPLRPWLFGNQHSKRHWLKDKPKFGQLASRLSCQILSNFKKTQELNT